MSLPAEAWVVAVSNSYMQVAIFTATVLELPLPSVLLEELLLYHDADDDDSGGDQLYHHYESSFPASSYFRFVV